MSSESDQYVVAAGTQPEANDALFKAKRWVYSVDSNSSGGQFGQEIQFDLGALGSQGDWTYLAEAQIAIPVFTTVAANDALFATSGSATFNRDLSVLKNGSHHFVHQAALSINGKMIQDFQSFQNVATHADMMTSFSRDQMDKWGATLHMSKSPEDYANFSNIGEKMLFTPKGISIQSYTLNPSLKERKDAQCAKSDGIASVMGVANNAGSSVVQVPTAATITAGNYTAGSYVYIKYDTVIIRLKDIVPAVRNIPPIKNIRGYLYLKLNSVAATLTTSNAVGAPITISSVSATAGSTSPVQLIPTDITDDAPVNLLSAGTATVDNCSWTLKCGPLGQNPSGSLTIPQAAHVNARLISPKYEANPDVDAALSMKKQFTVLERRASRVSLDPGNSNTFNINSGVPNPRFVRVSPFIVGKGTAAMTNLDASYNPFLSLVDSAGATTSPLAQLSNFNVYVGNKAVFQDPQNYNYEQFTQEIVKCGLNGGMDSEVSSGLLNETLWCRFYRYYVADISRRLPSEDGNLKSIQLQAKNDTKCRLDLLVDIYSERMLTIDTALCQFV